MTDTKTPDMGLPVTASVTLPYRLARPGGGVGGAAMARAAMIPRAASPKPKGIMATAGEILRSSSGISSLPLQRHPKQVAQGDIH
ncbi:hypothetical protein ES703_23081 [subsurface metagenome]